MRKENLQRAERGREGGAIYRTPGKVRETPPIRFVRLICTPSQGKGPQESALVIKATRGGEGLNQGRFSRLCFRCPKTKQIKGGKRRPQFKKEKEKGNELSCVLRGNKGSATLGMRRRVILEKLLKVV